VTKRSQAVVVTFGEFVPWLSGSAESRRSASRTRNATFGEGEANVAMPRSRSGILGAPASALSGSDLGEAVRSFIRGGGVDDADVVVSPDRIPTPGVAQRASRVLHDRAESGLARAGVGVWGWPRLLDGGGRRTCQGFRNMFKALFGSALERDARLLPLRRGCSVASSTRPATAPPTGLRSRRAHPSDARGGRRAEVGAR
jgi:hypothetical protein